MPFLEASAKDGSNVEKSFLMLVKDIFDKVAEKDDGGAPKTAGGVTVNASNLSAPPKKKRCIV